MELVILALAVEVLVPPQATALRTAVTQATEAFDLRVGGRIAEMLQTLEGDDSLEQKPSHLTVVDAEAALAVFAADKPSPGKGRVRELRRLQRLVRRLRRAMPG